jgi:hypothetical protein
MATAPATRKKTDTEVLFGERLDQYLDLDDNMNRIADREGLSRQQVDTERREFSDLITDLGLDRSDAQKLHNLATDARLHRGDEAWTKKAQRWPEESRRTFRERYGDEAESLDAAVSGLIEQHPALGKVVAGELAGRPEIRHMLVGVVRRGGPRGSQARSGGETPKGSAGYF